MRAGFVYLLAIWNLWPQIIPLIGTNGISPLKLTLSQIKKEIPHPILRFAYFPTVFWFGSSDTSCRAVVLAGVSSSIAIICGVYPSWLPQLPMAICYMVFLSWTNSASEIVMYPWQALLCEVGGLCLLINPDAPPCDYVRWLFRWVLFRLMFGFGKKKFSWGWHKHPYFIREFLVNMPSPNPIGLFAHKSLPAWTYLPKLLFMFFVEMIVPFFYFAPQPYRGGAALLTIMLMCGIQLTGNFGHFNILTSVASIPLLEGMAEKLFPQLASVADSTVSAPTGYFTLAYFVFSVTMGLIHLPLVLKCCLIMIRHCFLALHCMLLPHSFSGLVHRFASASTALCQGMD
jgi:hypothetical protein